MRTFPMIAILVLVALPLAAQPPNEIARCNFVGTWYGGSSAEIPYLLTASPSGRPGHYTIDFQLVLSPADIGYKMWTKWSGEAVKTTSGEFELSAISYWVMTHEYAVENGLDDSKPELDMVHGVARFTDCDTITLDIDLLTVFFAFDPTVDIPFTGPYDWELPPGETILETYQRMPWPANGALAPVPRLETFSVPTPQRKWRHR